MKILLSLIFCAFTTLHARTVTNPTEYAKTMIVKPNNVIRGLFIVPDDKVDQILLGLIENEQYSIVMMEFRVTGKKFEQALKAAIDRGVKVYIITDKTCFEERAEIVTSLYNYGAQVRYYDTPYSILHHKICIFSKNFFGKSIVVCGSANATAAGFTKNRENVFVTDEQWIIKRYQEEYTALLEKTKIGILPHKQPIVATPHRTYKVIYSLDTNKKKKEL